MGPGQQFFGDGPKIGLFQGGRKGLQVVLGLQGIAPGDAAGVVQRTALVQEVSEFRSRLRGQILGDGGQTLPVTRASPVKSTPTSAEAPAMWSQRIRRVTR